MSIDPRRFNGTSGNGYQPLLREIGPPPDRGEAPPDYEVDKGTKKASRLTIDWPSLFLGAGLTSIIAIYVLG